MLTLTICAFVICRSEERKEGLLASFDIHDTWRAKEICRMEEGRGRSELGLKCFRVGIRNVNRSLSATRLDMLVSF
jgi:hypothetical protein